jgi:hypothetical protein
MIEVNIVISRTERRLENVGWEDVCLTTEVQRYEFETEGQLDDWLKTASAYASRGEKLEAK